MARIEREIAASLGDQHYRDFKQAFRQVAEILSHLQPAAFPGRRPAMTRGDLTEAVMGRLGETFGFNATSA
jgi:hypothetical protein